MKKIYRVYGHDVEATDYPCRDLFYVTEQSKEDFIAQLEKDHDGAVVIDEVEEYTIDAVVQLLNMYIE